MKAESIVFTNLQKPMTVLGLPPVLLVGSAVAAILLFVLLALSGFPLLGFILFLALFAGLAIFFYRKTRQDHHYVNLLVVPRRFWRGRKHRHLIAGQPPLSSSRKVRS